MIKQKMKTVAAGLLLLATAFANRAWGQVETAPTGRRNWAKGSKLLAGSGCCLTRDSNIGTRQRLAKWIIRCTGNWNISKPLT